LTFGADWSKLFTNWTDLTLLSPVQELESAWFGEEEATLKHISCVSSRKPRPAELWQDVLCQVVMALNAIIEAFGGSAPLVGLINSKCEIPTPNDTGDQGTT